MIIDIDLYVPPDNDEAMEKKYKTPSFRYGTCGPAVIATLAHKTVKEILDLWVGEFRGHAPMKEMKLTLEKLGYTITSKRGNKSREFPKPSTSSAIVRIQWLKEDGTEYYWAAATTYTHYVLMQKIYGQWWIFCNSQKWFQKDSRAGRKYLELGYVSSYFEIGD